MKVNSNLLIKKLFGFSIGPIISSIIGFILIPINTWLFSPDDFGRASMYTLTVGLISMFLYFGIDQAFIREYNSEDNKNELLWNSFIIPFIFSIFSSILILVFSKNISTILFGENVDNLILVLAISIPITVINRFNVLIIRMQEKATIYSGIIIFQKAINFPILILLFFYYEKSFVVIVFSQFLSILMSTIVSLIINRSEWKFKFKINKELIKKLLKFALPILPASIFGWLVHSMDKIALRLLTDFTELGIYSVAFKIVMILEILKTGFKNFWIPTAYKWYENGVEIQFYEKTSHFLMTILVLIFSGIIIFKDLIFLIIGPNYRSASIVVPFLLFYPIMDILVTTTNLGINISRKTYYKLPIFVIVTGLNFLGNLLLVPLIGALGASISTGISFIFLFIAQSLISRKLLYYFKMKFYYYNIGLMVSLSIVSVFLRNTIIEMIIVLIVLLYNRKNLFGLYAITKNLIRKQIN